MIENELDYTCIFGGGAIRGISYIGAIKALEELNIHSKTIAGSSVGAIFAVLYAIGYTSEEIKNMFLKINFDLFRDIHFGFGKSFAISKGEVFLEWVRDLIEKKFYGENYKKGENPTVKFKDLDKNLIIITTDLTNFTCKEFSKFETPDFEVATAVRISSTMPGLMTPVIYEGVELVDGDLQKSQPLWKLSKHLQTPKERILEFRLEGDYAQNCKTAIDYLNTVYSCVTSIATRGIVETYGNNDKYDYITINTGEVIIVDFSIPIEKRQELMDIGYKQTMKHFKEVLPKKKEKLIAVYSDLKQIAQDISNDLNRKNVNDAKISLGKLYINLCDTKSLIDETIYEGIRSATFRFNTELKPSLILRKYPKENIKSVQKDFKQIYQNIKDKLEELQNYNKNIK